MQTRDVGIGVGIRAGIRARIPAGIRAGIPAARQGRARRGVALLWAIVIMVAILGITSLAVDFAYVQLVKSQLRMSLDAASLAGVSGVTTSPAEARLRAKTIAAANNVNGVPLVLLDSDIELGQWNSTTRVFTLFTGSNEVNATAARVTAKLSNARGTQVNLLFAKLLGQKYVEMSAQSVGGFAAGADVVIVQDVTTSFSSELSDAKTGDQALLDSLKAGGGKGGMGLVAFTGWGQTIAPLQYVGSNYTALTSAVTSLKLAGSTGMPKASGTDQAAGIAQGITVFNNWSNPSPTGKAMILVTDGEPTQDSGGSHPSSTAAQLLTLAQAQADAAWAKKIHLYVVFFNPTNSVTAANNMKTLIRGNGDFVSVSSGSQLPTALAEITKKLPIQLCK